MFSHIIEEFSTTLHLKAEGREQRDRLNKIFRQCSSAQVLECEFKDKLRNHKWFTKTPELSSNPYLSAQDADKTNWLTLDKAFEIVSTLLQWSEEKKAKFTKQQAIPDLCFDCIRTKVSTKEFTDNVIASGFFGTAVSATYVPPRGSPTPFVKHDIFLSGQPDTLAWGSIRKLYTDVFNFQKVESSTDNLVRVLQVKCCSKLDKSLKAKTDGVRQNQIDAIEIPFIKFFRTFSSDICKLDLQHPEKSDAFWSTETGKRWKEQADNITASIAAAAEAKKKSKKKPVAAPTDDASSSSANGTGTAVVVAPSVDASITISWATIYAGLMDLWPVVFDMDRIKSDFTNCYKSSKAGSSGAIVDILKHATPDTTIIQERNEQKKLAKEESKALAAGAAQAEVNQTNTSNILLSLQKQYGDLGTKASMTLNEDLLQTVSKITADSVTVTKDVASLIADVGHLINPVTYASHVPSTTTTSTTNSSINTSSNTSTLLPGACPPRTLSPAVHQWLSAVPKPNIAPLNYRKRYK